MNYRLGKWYEARGQVRADYCEYWKGILIQGKRTAVIYNYTGARRIHYGDCFDTSTGKIMYVGEGKSGDQVLNGRNARLKEMVNGNSTLNLFLDCGDLFKPKKILYAGKWYVTSVDYTDVVDRKVYLYTLKPTTHEIVEFLQFTFFDTEHHKFEKSLSEFARIRSVMYRDFPEVLRVRDNVIGEIGEYYAVKALNNVERNSVIRLSSGIKNIDAVQISNGRTYAIKTIGKIPQSTSNIWAANPDEAVDDYVVVLIDHEKLKPRCIMRMSSRRAAKFMRTDNYQGSKKLAVTREFAESSEILLGAVSG